MTEREELAKIVMKWLRTAKPDNAEAPSDLIDDVIGWHKKGQPKPGLDEEEVEKLILRNCESVEPHRLEPKKMGRFIQGYSKQLAKAIVAHFSKPTGIRIPERRKHNQQEHHFDEYRIYGFNECLDLVEKMNQ